MSELKSFQEISPTNSAVVDASRYAIGRGVLNLEAIRTLEADNTLTNLGVTLELRPADLILEYVSAAEVGRKGIDRALGVVKTERRPEVADMRHRLNIEYARIKRVGLDTSTIDLFITFSPPAILQAATERLLVRRLARARRKSTPQYWLGLGRLSGEQLQDRTLAYEACQFVDNAMPEKLVLAAVDKINIIPDSSKGPR